MIDRKLWDMMTKIREGLMQNGKRVGYENPDRLSEPELRALTDRIFIKLNELNGFLGYQTGNMGNMGTYGVRPDRIDELWVDFMDWYEIAPTSSVILLDYIKRNYPVEKFRNILCVGDGKCSHVGRKLAALGYNAVSVDPLARREFAIKKQSNKPGRLHVVQGQFLRTSTNMIEWADLIVGAKVPQCAEELIGLKKETVFNISDNAEIHNISFRGVPITSSQVLVDEIRKCPGVITKRCNKYQGLTETDPGILLFISKECEREDREH